jgi:hypothetical protein
MTAVSTEQGVYTKRVDDQLRGPRADGDDGQATRRLPRRFRTVGVFSEWSDDTNRCDRVTDLLRFEFLLVLTEHFGITDHPVIAEN